MISVQHVYTVFCPCSFNLTAFLLFSKSNNARYSMTAARHAPTHRQQQRRSSAPSCVSKSPLNAAGILKLRVL